MRVFFIEIRALAILMLLFCIQIEGFAKGINMMLTIRSAVKWQIKVRT